MILLKQYVLCLQELPVFKVLTNNQSIGEIRKKKQKLYVKKGQILFHQGDEAKYLYLVKAGMLKLVYYDLEGNEKILDMIGPKECVGESAFWSTKYDFDAIALENTFVCCYNFDYFRTVILGNPDYAEKMIKYLGQKLDDGMFRIKDNEGLSVKDKLRKQLDKLAHDYGQLMEDGYNIIIKLKLTQKDLANLIGASRLMVNNALRELKKDLLIDKQDGYYILKNDQSLIKNFIKKFTNV
ncbi:MAG: CRP-like cAMP-activated global transcriptional regulator [Candidatus Dichloromethanomonas elyunquensis]|nr:MAG: CRP-like cAMP-activated global transcriptional regulator [Candidatus Dichloromethanomonas elyunquensis]